MSDVLVDLGVESCSNFLRSSTTLSNEIQWKRYYYIMYSDYYLFYNPSNSIFFVHSPVYCHLAERCIVCLFVCLSDSICFSSGMASHHLCVTQPLFCRIGKMMVTDPSPWIFFCLCSVEIFSWSVLQSVVIWMNDASISFLHLFRSTKFRNSPSTRTLYCTFFLTLAF